MTLRKDLDKTVIRTRNQIIDSRNGQLPKGLDLEVAQLWLKDMDSGQEDGSGHVRELLARIELQATCALQTIQLATSCHIANF